MQLIHLINSNIINTNTMNINFLKCDHYIVIVYVQLPLFLKLIMVVVFGATYYLSTWKLQIKRSRESQVLDISFQLLCR